MVSVKKKIRMNRREKNTHDGPSQIWLILLTFGCIFLQRLCRLHLHTDTRGCIRGADHAPCFIVRDLLPTSTHRYTASLSVAAWWGHTVDSSNQPSQCWPFRQFSSLAVINPAAERLFLEVEFAGFRYRDTCSPNPIL